jgi:hypothetical protein
MVAQYEAMYRETAESDFPALRLPQNRQSLANRAEFDDHTLRSPQPQAADVAQHLD